MSEPDSLFRPTVYGARHDEDATGVRPTLVITMAGYGDAGHAQELINEHLLERFPNHKLGTFDVDQLIDYTENRPTVVFDHDHFRQYEAPEMTLHEVTDAQGHQFLLLSGPEPAYQWERLAASIESLIADYRVERTVFLQSMPAPTPHTRPVWVSGYASDPSLLDEVDGLPGAFKMGSTFTAMLSVRLGEHGRDVLGLVAHVPHYLSDNPYPEAAIALLDKVGPIGQVSIPPSSSMIQEAQRTRRLIESQVRDSEEVTGVVNQLEDQYDHWVSQRAINPRPAIPSPDEIGAEVEQFLAGLAEQDPTDPQDGPDATGGPVDS